MKMIKPTLKMTLRTPRANIGPYEMQVFYFISQSEKGAVISSNNFKNYQKQNEIQKLLKNIV